MTRTTSATGLATAHGWRRSSGPARKAYNAAEEHALKLSDDGTNIGSVKTSGNFTFVRLHAGGHMVPHDQPVASLDMLNRWLGGEWLAAS